MLKIVNARRYHDDRDKMGNMTRAVRDLFVENEKLKKELRELYQVAKGEIEKAGTRESEAIRASRESEEIMKRALEFMMSHAMQEVPN